MGAAFAFRGQQMKPRCRLQSCSISFTVTTLIIRFFISRPYINVDETWIHYYTLETKEQSQQWIFTEHQKRQRPWGPQARWWLVILGCKGTRLINWLLGKGTNNNWRVLCTIIRPITRFSPPVNLFLSELKKIAWWARFHGKWGCHHLNKRGLSEFNFMDGI